MGYSALIIEDEPLVAMELEFVLVTFGFVVCDTAMTEDAAVAAALTHKPDLITADVQLLDGNGIRAVERIAEEHEACVIFITADWQEVKARVEGAICVQKPFGANRIASAIAKGLPSFSPKQIA